MVTALIEELVAEKAVEGQLKGGATSWVPAIHQRRQQDSLNCFYQQNGYVG
jgi:hypothetical protein